MNETSKPTETVQTFAEKLRKAGYREPAIEQPTPEQVAVQAKEHHGLCIVRGCTDTAHPGQVMCLDHCAESDAIDLHLRNLANYREVMATAPTFWQRMRARAALLWDKVWGGLCLIAAVLLTTFGCVAMAHGADVPTWVLRGIAAQENGVHWNDTGDIDGKWSRGTTGAVGPWHISLGVLSDLGLSAHADRLHADPVYAESITRLWLLRLYAVTGDWREVCAAWRAGLRNRHRAWARDYAERAFNYGTTY